VALDFYFSPVKENKSHFIAPTAVVVRGKKCDVFSFGGANLFFSATSATRGL